MSYISALEVNEENPAHSTSIGMPMAVRMSVEQANNILGHKGALHRRKGL